MKRVILALAAFVLMCIVSYTIDPYSVYWGNYFIRPWSEIVSELAVSLIFCLLISECSIFIHNKLNSHLPWTESPLKRLIIEEGLNLTAVLGLIMLELTGFYLINNDPLPIIHTHLSVDETRGMLQWIIVSGIISFIITAINTGNYLIHNWRNTSLEAAEHQLRVIEQEKLAMYAELESLKLQIDPHFVFNNLSVLSELILKDQMLGYEYSERFSKVYRYLLTSSRKNLISLEEEIKFLQSFIFLMKYRTGDKVVYVIDITIQDYHLYIPPLTLQLLFENALKHNKLLKSAPLYVRVYSSKNNTLTVENTLRPLSMPAESSGMGVKNIMARYSILSEKRLPTFTSSDDKYTVVLPLLDLQFKEPII